jgi:hypothetical protein
MDAVQRGWQVEEQVATILDRLQRFGLDLNDVLVAAAGDRLPALIDPYGRRGHQYDPRSHGCSSQQ